jgi:hypothetical protein
VFDGHSGDNGTFEKSVITGFILSNVPIVNANGGFRMGLTAIICDATLHGKGYFCGDRK